MKTWVLILGLTLSPGCHDYVIDDSHEQTQIGEDPITSQTLFPEPNILSILGGVWLVILSLQRIPMQALRAKRGK